MQVDKNKFEITEKQFKRVEFLKSNQDYEKRIVNAENELQAVYDKIYQLELHFKGPGF